ncbi:MAG: phosphoenolpyruvate carboxykinase [Planctomycetota bacterium]|nr:MAG: phosphoenolpyruvate carboxykinase [Planctomycetota bacterium]
MSNVRTLPVQAKSVLLNPSAEELRELIAKMPNARLSEFGNYNVETKVVARSKVSTYVVTDSPENHSDQTISRAEYEKWAAIQDAYIKDQEMVVIEGYIGSDPDFRVPARLIIESANANVAAMQKELYFPLEPGDEDSFEPKVQVIYTPNLKAEGLLNDRLIAVDLENGISRVFNSDYFGESKKGGLRKWNKLVYDRGGLALHAGCKIIPTDQGKRTALIIGLSGTGKTTTTFTQQNGSQPVQDDFVALMPGGKVYSTENGCFAKTFGLDPRFEPTIHAAVTQPDAYLENISMDENGKVDFFDTSYTANGRAVFGMRQVPGSADAREIEKADFLLILSRSETLMPAVARISGPQAAAYFMLGETKGTSAGGAEEAGKSLRVPGTNPFFPLLHASQGNRFFELLKTCNIEVYLMNTGRVGGGEDVEGSKKVKIPHSSAVVKAIAEGTIEWEKDEDFGYEVAKNLPDFPEEDLDLLQPKKLYQALGREDEYQALVEKLVAERREYLQAWPGLVPEVVGSI